MSMRTRYEGSFYSVKGILYRIELLQEGFMGKASTVAFGSAPLEIEWTETDKLEPVQSSKATLTLFSDNDRQFVNLYTVKAGDIRLDIYREEKLYWRGTLDPELYEEPYSFKEGYEVSLTFSDLAILDRLSWTKEDYMTMEEIIVHCLEKSGLQDNDSSENPLIEKYISTQVPSGVSGNLLTEVSVQTQNFFDEDGESLSMREALEETLRPFALRLLQKEGKIIIYDLQALSIFPASKTDEIYWESNDAVLGVDKLYSNVKVSFSPYEKTELLKGKVDPNLIKKNEDPEIKTWIGYWGLREGEGFFTHLSNEEENNGLIKHPDARFFRIEPIYSGQEDAGIAWTVKTYDPTIGDCRYISYIQDASAAYGQSLFKIKDKAFIAKSSERKEYRLKINLSLLFDVRYNPFEVESESNEDSDYKKLINRCNYAYVPIKLNLRDQQGNVYHWENKLVKASKSYEHNGDNCRWLPGEASWGDAWLCWYDDDRKDKTGLGGWKNNRQIIGHCREGKLPSVYQWIDPAEYIDLPDKDGFLELEIGTGVECYDNDSNTKWHIADGIYEKVRWLLYKDASVTIVGKNYKSYTPKDSEHTAWVNRNAREELTIDTILGTLKNSSPTALGQLFRTDNYEVIPQFTRAGVTDRLERLLIGTVYSNYAQRNNTLSGSAALSPSFGVYTDPHTPLKEDEKPVLHILLKELQHLREDESEITMVQFSADNYQGVEFTDED